MGFMAKLRWRIVLTALLGTLPFMVVTALYTKEEDILAPTKISPPSDEVHVSHLGAASRSRQKAWKYDTGLPSDKDTFIQTAAGGWASTVNNHASFLSTGDTAIGLSASDLSQLVVTGAEFDGGYVASMPVTCITRVSDTAGAFILSGFDGHTKLVQIQLSIATDLTVMARALAAKYVANTAVDCNEAAINSAWSSATAGTVATSSTAAGYGIKHLVVTILAETNITTIYALTQDKVNVAALPQGSSCTSSSSYNLGGCNGSLNGLLGDSVMEGGGYVFLAGASGDWIKVQFRSTFLIKMMGLAQRSTAARWLSVTLEDSNGASQVVPLSVGHGTPGDYALYDVQDMNTDWIKFSGGVPTSKPSAAELEFYADKTGSLETVCPWNPTLLSSHADCAENWNQWTLGSNANRYNYMEFRPENWSEAGLSVLDPGSWVERTSAWGGQIGFRVQHYTVRVTSYGDCRQVAQGPSPQSLHYIYEKTCVQVKWMACHQGSCKNKKMCFIKDTASIPASASVQKNCMMARCDDQCAMS